MPRRYHINNGYNNGRIKKRTYKRNYRNKPYVSRLWTRKVFYGKEMKFIDTETVNDAFSTAWATMEDATALCINGIGQNDGESGRDGRVVWLHKVSMKYFLIFNNLEAQSAPTADFLARVGIVIDKQANGATIDVSDVYDEGLNNDVLAFRNLREISRFNVIYDKRIRIQPFDLSEGSANNFANGIWVSPIYQFHKTFNPPLKVDYGGTGATVAAISNIALHVIGICTAASVLLNSQTRVRFTD